MIFVMIRRVSFCILCAFLWLNVLAALASAAAPRPNVILIISDDQTYRDFGFMGNDLVQTPNLDRLATASARYVNGYVPTSVCSPSLATLLTGLYPHQNGIHYNHPPPGNSGFNKMKSRAEYERVRNESFYLIKSQPTLPRVLAKAGYRCLQTGKFWEGHFRNAGFTDGMTIFEPPPGQTFGGVRTLAGGVKAAHGNGDWGLKIGRETMKPIYDFIDDCDRKETPFFVWYAPYLPHQPHDSPKKYFDLYRGNLKIAEHEIPYLASISQFDDTVGALMDHVEKKGLTEETLFVFVTDNGWTPGKRRHKTQEDFFFHTKESKRSPFEDGLRTPILLSWKGVTKPGTHEELVSSVDLVPTILSAVGGEAAIPNLPGVDLMSSAKGDAKLDAKRPVYGGIYPGDATSLGHPSRDLAYRWIRDGDFKLIVPSSQDGKKPWGGYLQGAALFDVVGDPRETKNLVADPKQAPRLARMKDLLDEWWTPGDDSRVLKPEAKKPVATVKREIYIKNTVPHKAPWVWVYSGKPGYREEIQTVWSHDDQVRGYGDTPTEPRRRVSHDDGQTWSPLTPLPSLVTFPDKASIIDWKFCGIYDPASERHVSLAIHHVRDMRQGPPRRIYNHSLIRLSYDDGKTFGPPHMLRNEGGADFDPEDLLNPDYLENNNGYPGQSIFRHSNGSLIIPVTNSRIPADVEDAPLGRTVWPTKGTIGSHCFVGRWNKDKQAYDWQAGKPAWLLRETAYNGLLEADVAELTDGRVLIVWRVTRYKDSPACKYYGVSSDGGLTFTKPRPFTYSNGANFFSTSTFHRLFRSSKTKKLYWIGNIAPEKPTNAGHPRYPLIIGEIDEETLGLKKETVTEVDTRHEGEGKMLQLSNFWIIEHSKTHELEVYLTRLYENPDELFTANCYKYTVTFNE
jgi:arylsulfatase A